MRKPAGSIGLISRWQTSTGQLAALFGLAGGAVVLALLGQLTGVGATRLSEPGHSETVDLLFEDGPGGSITVSEATRTRQPIVIAPREHGFVRTALRSLARERQAEGTGAAIPFRLGRTDAGNLWLRDLASGRLLYLDAYGPQSASSFGKLLALRTRSE
ncbi:MAG: photosynthetic complex assembly protein PuhC [Proteobacteria bacterium]|nr:photosynthetic complex assembly protein PuhC [Pseudomonadota bacterium]